ncbi:MAG: carboxypeptidase Q [Bradymonadia bacterium]|jgi:carboxypeptidase Q
MVPHWRRNQESLTLLEPRTAPMRMLGLGDSVPTAGVLQEEVVVCRSFDDLGPHVAGKIVLFNSPMLAQLPRGPEYGKAVGYRALGASRAAAHGAVGVLVRSVTVGSLASPHTGGLRYLNEIKGEAVPKIPAAAVSVEDAELIDRLSVAGHQVLVAFDMNCETLPDAPSCNLLAEIPGSDPDLSDEIVLVSGHLDSWDIGQGAQDDGAGVMHAVGAARLIRELGVAPRRTIRVVLWTNEENGTRGGHDYVDKHGDEPHALAIESDAGAGQPLAWKANGTAEQMKWLTKVAALTGIPVEAGGGGVDIAPLMKKRSVLGTGLRNRVDAYFDIHHTEADTIDKIDPALFKEGLAMVAALTWQAANED